MAASIVCSCLCRYVLPFSEVIDWDKASLTIDERQLLQVGVELNTVLTC